VQGAGAAESIARSLALLDANAERLGIDVIIVARGGGSLEDLWAFNEEPVARAVCACRTPVISGVGHEVDVTICDLVADVRAATPTAAAELAVPDRADVARHLQAAHAKLAQHVTHALARSRQQLDALLRTAVFRDPLGRLRTQVQRLDEISHRLRMGLANELTAGRRRLEPAANRLAALHPARLAERARAALDRLAGRMAWALGGRSKREGDRLTGLAGRLEAVHPRAALALARQKVESASRQLEALSYRAVLQRGFSVTRAGGRIVRSAADIQPGQAMETELPDGRVRSTADAEPGPQAPPPASEAPAVRTRAPRKKPSPCEPGLFD
jgi:exodeoxyribonuclease VII large subunit